MPLLASAIEEHPNLKYLDISYNNISNSGFKSIYAPLQRNKSKIEVFQCRGNNIGGSPLDRVLSTISHSLKVLNLSCNKLSEFNGNVLLDYAKNNIQIEKICVH